MIRLAVIIATLLATGCAHHTAAWTSEYPVSVPSAFSAPVDAELAYLATLSTSGAVRKAVTVHSPYDRATRITVRCRDAWLACDEQLHAPDGGPDLETCTLAVPSGGEGRLMADFAPGAVSWPWGDECAVVRVDEAR